MDRLGRVLGLDFLGAVQVCDGAGDFEDSDICARGKGKALHGRGQNALGRAVEIGIVDGRHLHLNVNAVEQGPVDAREILLNLPRRAMALLARIGQVAAGTPVRTENKPTGAPITNTHVVTYGVWRDHGPPQISSLGVQLCLDSGTGVRGSGESILLW